MFYNCSFSSSLSYLAYVESMFLASFSTSICPTYHFPLIFSASGLHVYYRSIFFTVSPCFSSLPLLYPRLPSYTVFVPSPNMPIPRQSSFVGLPEDFCYFISSSDFLIFNSVVLMTPHIYLNIVILATSILLPWDFVCIRPSLCLILNGQSHRSEYQR